MLRGDSAFGLLMFASSLLTVTDPRMRDPFTREEPVRPSRDDLLSSFLDIELPATSGLLTAIAPMLDDEVTARRIRREVDRRGHRLPPWLTGLAPLELGTPLQMSHILGDGDSILIPARTAAGEQLTALVYVDHNMGTLTKDAFVIDAPSDEAVRRFREQVADDPDTTFTALDPAEARAKVDEAISTGAITYPPFESDTWPGCRPLVEWVVRHLPAGGTGYQRPEWEDDDRAALIDRFLASRWGARYGDELSLEQLEWLMWYGCDYGPGDPTRWSTVKVELLLTDWVPRKIVTDTDDLIGLPDLLRDLIRFVHDEVGIRDELTEETLDGVDRWEPDYQRAIRSPRLQGPAALLGAMGLLDEDGGDGGYGALLPGGGLHAVLWQQRTLERLEEEVGGAEQLDELDTSPLPDEPFDRSALPDHPTDVQLAQRIDDILELLDGACERFFDVEHRTACRRLLADVLARSPEALGRGRTDTAAAALVWLVARANDSFQSRTGGLAVGEVAEWFGLAAVSSQRATTFL
ncbi:MAG TPA: DUF6398 domain-containing protein, partial [Nitriliruptorales bacterium]